MQQLSGFYLIFTILINIIIINGYLDNEVKRQYLDYHNKVRREVQPTAANMKIMRWNKTMQSLGQDWSDRCVFEHPDPNNKYYAPYGQNIFMYTYTPEFKYTAALDAFFDEAQYFTYPDKCVSGKVCGHYTTMVRARWSELGCGASLCNGKSDVFIVCQYGSRDDDYVDDVYKKGKSCSKCPKTYVTCDQGLCSNGEESDFSGAFENKYNVLIYICQLISLYIGKIFYF